MDIKNLSKYILVIKKIILVMSLASFVVLFKPDSFVLFGKMAWWLLLFIVFIRPLADILNNITFLKILVGFRKEIGIMCGTFGLAHGVGFFLNNNMSLIDGFTNPIFWSLGNYLGWGMLALVISIPLIITSNIYSINLLGRHWKTLQRLTYLFFIFVAVHIAFIKPGQAVILGMIVLSWMILWIVAYKRYNIEKNKDLIYGVFILLILINGSGTYYSGLKEVRDQNSIERSGQTMVAENSQDMTQEKIGIKKTDDYVFKLTINPTCIGCRKCVDLDPFHYKMDHDTNKAIVISQEKLDDPMVAETIKICPVGAINLS